MRIVPLLLLIASLSAFAEPVYHPGTTRKVMQLTGDRDATLRSPTLSQTGKQADVLATDLGHAFEHKGRMCFLFGDTVGRGEFLLDCLAFSDSTDPANLIIEFPTKEDGRFVPLSVPGLKRGAMEVPVGGISLGGRMYVVFTSGFDLFKQSIERSAMARSDDDGRTWTYLYDVSRATNHDMKTMRFLVVDMLEVDAESNPGLPYESGKVVLIWGSGPYRASNLSLACVPSASFEDRSAFRFYAGDARWSTEELDAAPLFDDPQVGEFSIDWIGPVQRWVVLYNAQRPPGVLMRTSAAPWGPFSDAERLVDPIADGGFANWMHVPNSLGYWDNFADPGKEDVPGGLYGPYLINRFTKGDAGRCTLYYTLSTWNPYQVVLMSSEIGEPLPPRATTPREETLQPGGEGWTRGGGALWRRLPGDATWLKFHVSGPGGDVVLIEGDADIPTDADPGTFYRDLKDGRWGRVVACAWGRPNARIHIPVRWHLSPYQRLTLVLTATPGDGSRFSVSPMALTAE